jgi:integrase
MGHQLRKYLLDAEHGGESLYRVLSPLSPYTKRTIFMRFISLEAWAKKQGISTYGITEWYEEHKNLFKYSYEKKSLLSPDEIVHRISQIKNTAARIAANEIYSSGLRIHEYAKVSEHRVVGKGGKPRRVRLKEPSVQITERQLRYALAKVGLKPHDLRKAFATKAAAQLSPAELCKVMGWSSFETASSYIYVDENIAERVVV